MLKLSTTINAFPAPILDAHWTFRQTATGERIFKPSIKADERTATTLDVQQAIVQPLYYASMFNLYIKVLNAIPAPSAQ